MYQQFGEKSQDFHNDAVILMILSLFEAGKKIKIINSGKKWKKYPILKNEKNLKI